MVFPLGKGRKVGGGNFHTDVLGVLFKFDNPRKRVAVGRKAVF
jgi:hypothetical protein